MLNSCQQPCRDREPTILMIQCLTRRKKEQIINTGLINTEYKVQNLEKEALRILLQGLIGRCQPHSIHLIEWDCKTKSDKRRWQRKSQLMVLDLLTVNLITRGSTKAKDRKGQLLAIITLWLSGKAKARMPRRITGLDAYLQGGVEEYIIDILSLKI